MERPEKTVKGYSVNRRCDTCGTRISMTVDQGDKCILKCSKCGKEYRFYCKRPD